MTTTKEHTQITIQGNDLVSAYGVYIVLIDDNNTTYCYVGQTGDARYISARSPFYRIAAHLSYGKSTQNQVYEGLKQALNVQNGNSRAKMEEWLAGKELKIHFFKTDDFEFMIDTKANKESHTYKRRRTLGLETALLTILKENQALTLLNKSKVTYKDFESYAPRAEQIIKELGL